MGAQTFQRNRLVVPQFSVLDTQESAFVEETLEVLNRALPCLPPGEGFRTLFKKS